MKDKIMLKSLIIICYSFLFSCCHYEITMRQFGMTEPIRIPQENIIKTDTVENLIKITFKEKICE